MDQYVYIVSYYEPDREYGGFVVSPCLVGMYETEEEANNVVEELKMKYIKAKNNLILAKLQYGLNVTKVKLGETKELIENRGDIVYTRYEMTNVMTWNYPD